MVFAHAGLRSAIELLRFAGAGLHLLCCGFLAFGRTGLLIAEEGGALISRTFNRLGRCFSILRLLLPVFCAQVIRR